MTQPLRLKPFSAGTWFDGDAPEQIVLDKYSNDVVTVAESISQRATTWVIDRAVEGAARARLSQYERAQVLHRASHLVRERRTELVDTVLTDTGFTLADSAKEVDRTAETLRLCAEEATRLAGEMVPIAGAAGQEGRIAFTRFDPLGVVCAITPFNSPLNTVAHKVGPAIAAGNGVILKPATQTPRSADALVRLLLDAGLPPELISVVYGSGSTVGQWLAEDLRPAFYAFTGSTSVGTRLHRTVGLRRTQLEMGSLASTIICADAELERAATLAMNAAFRKSGQVCTSVQRLYVHEDVVADVASLLATGLQRTMAGDPRDPETFVGPVIAPAEADRIEQLLDDALDGGAEVVSGGSRIGNVIKPTVLTNVSMSSAVMSSELFGPVVALRPFSELTAVLDEVNDTPYGLAGGIFTRDLDTAFNAIDALHMGSVHINETSSSRVDLQPFAGLKLSGFGGAEGPRYAIREMSEERLITVRRS